MLEDALGFPRRDEDWVKTVVIGGLCIVFSFLVVPAILLQGYLMAVLRGGGGDAEPPAFDDLGGLLVDGLKAWVVQFVYALVPTVLLFGYAALVGFSVMAATSDGPVSAGTGVIYAVFGIAGFGVLLVVALLAAYLSPAALALVARTGRIGAAFEFGRLKRVTFTSEYLVGVLLYLLVVFVGSFAGGLLAVLLVGFFVVFYAQVAGFYVLATAVEDALPAEA